MALVRDYADGARVHPPLALSDSMKEPGMAM